MDWPNKHREKELEVLYERYALESGWKRKWIYWRKKIIWLLVIGLAQALKRLVDIGFSLSLILLLTPLMLAVALCIRLTDGGPVVYWSRRIGKWGEPFDFPKFRSMRVGADREKDSLDNDLDGSVTFKKKVDPRCTWIGRIIRKLSIDELPQLWCVLRGEMTLVGPRPPLPSEVAEYTIEQRRRLDVIPGLTCIWQVSGRSDLAFHQQVSLDMEYIQSQSFLLDLKILVKTIPAVLLGKGAY